MTHGADGIGGSRRPGLMDLLKTAAARDINSGRSPEALFGKALVAALQQRQESPPPGQVPRTHSVQPVIESPASPAKRVSDDDFSGILKVVLQHEGISYVKNDGGRGASRMGILQSTARAYGFKGDVKNITRADVEGIYRKIWEKSGAAGLPYPLSLIHFDTYVNSPAAARKILKASGGNVDRYLQLRGQRYHRLAELRPQRFAKYLKGWMNRVGHLQQMATAYAKAQSLPSETRIV